MKKTLLLLLSIGIISNMAYSQNVIISTSSSDQPNSKAILELKSNALGFLPPRMTTAQRDLLTTTLTTNEDGLQIYNTDKGNLELFNGQFWESAQTPIGTVMAYSGATIPKGWALCDGTSKFTNDVLFHDLFLRIGNTWGGDGTTTFNLPDLRAATLRGTGISTKFTSNVTINLGQLINDQFQGHYHNTNDPGHEHANPARIAVNTGTAYNIWSYTGASIQDSYTTRQTANITILDPSTNASNGLPRTGNETTGKAFGINYIIKY